MEDIGLIDLYVGDESHFGLTPNVPYTWQTKENPDIATSVQREISKWGGLNEP